MENVSRRRLLEAAGGAFAVSSLAGCTGGDSTASETTRTSEATRLTTDETTTADTTTTTDRTTEETTQAASETVPPPDSYRWRIAIDGGISRQPVVADGMVYLSSGGVYALDAASGEQRWERSVSKGVRQRPVLHDGILYVVSGFSACGIVEDFVCYAFDAATGEVRWEFTPRREEQPLERDEGTLRLLAVTDDGVYLSEHYQDDWTALYAVNLDGSVLWRAEYAGFISRAAATDGDLYLTDPRPHCRDAETGAVRWEADGNFGGLSVADGVLYAEDRDGLTAFDATDGSVRWRVKTRSRPEWTLEDETIYAIDRKRFLALDAATGRERWRYDDDNYLETPVPNANSVYLGSDNGIRALHAEDGSVRWEFGRQSDGEHHTVGVAAADAVYARTQSGFYRLDPADGEPQWRLDIRDVNEFTPVGGTVYAGDGYESAFAIDAPEEVTTSETVGKMAASSGVAYSDGRTARSERTAMTPALGFCSGGK